jgi:hypothetical protein
MLRGRHPGDGVFWANLPRCTRISNMPGRLLPSLIQSVRVTSRAIWRATKQLFHETTGAFFGLFALYGSFAAWRQWRQRPILWIIVAAVAYSVTMALFCFGSFRRARRVR